MPAVIFKTGIKSSLKRAIFYNGKAAVLLHELPRELVKTNLSGTIAAKVKKMVIPRVTFILRLNPA